MAAESPPQWNDRAEYSEPERVFLWRYEQARRSGLDIDAARAFAGGRGDLEQLRTLAERGVNPALLAAILT